MRSLAWDLIPYDWYPYKKRKLQIHAQREVDVKTQREDAIHKPKKKASEETNSAHTLISGFQLQDCDVINVYGTVLQGP